MSYQTIELSIVDRVAMIQFMRPDSLNAMSGLMMEEIIDAVECIADSPDAHVALTMGSGRAYMAGADIKEYAAFSDEEFVAFQTRAEAMYAAVEQAPQPFIAAVNGYAFGGGFELALAHDLILASDKAKFGLPEIKLHLIPGGGGTQRLPVKVGRHRANDLLMTGRAATADELSSWGLLAGVYPIEEFEASARNYAIQLAAQSAPALVALKRLTLQAVPPPKTEALTEERRHLVELHDRQEARNAIREFCERSAER